MRKTFGAIAVVNWVLWVKLILMEMWWSAGWIQEGGKPAFIYFVQLEYDSDIESHPKILSHA